MWIRPTFAIIFLLIAFIGIGMLISMVFGLFGSEENTNSNLNDLVADLRQNQSTVVIVINNNTLAAVPP
jgi:hypothetical protein